MNTFASEYPDTWEDLIDDWAAAEDMRRAESRWQEPEDADDED